MNVFMFWINDDGEKELVTPPLEMGVILPGVTRQSLLDLANEMGGFKVGLSYSFVFVVFVCSTRCNNVRAFFVWTHVSICSSELL